MKKWAIFASVVAVFFLAVLQNTRPSKGFSDKKIFSCALASHYSENTTSDDVSLTEEIEKILSQEFYYIGSGSQTYAFHSADGNHVIKFFKSNHLVPKQWLSWCRYIPPLQHIYERKVLLREARCRQLADSCLQASTALSQETGVLFAHVRSSRVLNKKISVMDRSGKKHRIALDQFVFVIQKRAKPLEHYLKECITAGLPEKARMGIHALGELIEQRCRKGFYDRDQGVVTNFGFVGDRIVQMDFGRLIYENSAKDPKFVSQEKKRVINRLRSWYAHNQPELRDIFLAVQDDKNPRQSD